MKTTWLFRPHSFLTATLVATVATLILCTAPSALAAGPYYWDCNNGDPGFGTAQGSFAGSTVPTATYGWSTDATGSTTISPGSGVNPGTGSAVNFGTATDGLGSGTITVGGSQNIGDITFGGASGAIILNGGTINQGSAPTITVNNSLDTINSVVNGAANGLTIAGSGTLVLNGLNGFTGKLIIGNNVASTLKVQFNTIGNVGATTGSSLGKPATAANGLIQIGFGARTSTLEFTGASAAGSTDRQVQVGSPSGVGSATILNNNADPAYSLTFANAAFNVAVTTASARNLTLGGTNAGNNQIQGAIINNTGTDAKVAVVKSNSGTWTLSGANTYSGTTAVNEGSLNIASTGTINSSSGVTVAAGARFVYNSSTSLTVGTTLNGNGTANRAVLGGTGNIGSTMILDNLGDTLAPGNSPGIQTFTPAQTWSSFSYDWEVNNFTGTTAGTDFDQIGIGSTLDLSGGSGSYILNVLGLTAGNVSGNVPNFSEINRSWTILTSTGISGFNAANWTINTVGFNDPDTGNWSLGQSGNNLVLSYTVVPETNVAALIGGFGLLALLRRRR